MSSPTFNTNTIANEGSGAGNGVNPDTKTKTATITIPAGATVVVFVGHDVTGGSISSAAVSDGTNSYVAASGGGLQSINGSVAFRFACFIAKNCAAVTAGTLSVSFTGFDNGNGWDIIFTAFVIDSADATAPQSGSVVVASGSGNSLTSGSFNVADANSLVLAWLCASNQNNTWSAGAIGAGGGEIMPSQGRFPAAPNTRCAGEYKAFAAAQTGITATVNGGNGDQLALMVIALKATAATVVVVEESVPEDVFEQLTDRSMEPALWM